MKGLTKIWTGLVQRLIDRHPDTARDRALLDQVFRAFPGPLAFKDPAGLYLRANEAMANRLGLATPAQLVGRRDAELAAAGGREGREPDAEGEGGGGFAGTSVAVRDERGELVGTLLACVDASALDAARRRAQALEDERDLLRNILNRVPDQIYVKNDRHQFIVANAAVARKITGAPEDAAVVGRTDHDFFPKADADKYQADEAQLMASGRDIIDLEERAVYQGRTRWNLSTKVVLRDKERRVIGLVGINRDITARKEVEAALAAERNLLHSLMDNIPDCIYFKDGEGRFIRANRAQAELLGASSPERLAGHRLSEFLPGGATKEADADEREILRTGRPVLGKVEQIKSGDGLARWLLCSKVPIRDGEGQISGLVGISKDITDRKNAEQALEHSLASFLDFANGAAEGDLTLRAPEGSDTVGRIGAAVNRMLDGFSAILADLKQMASHVSGASSEILAASNHIAAGAGRQYDEIHTTSSSVDEMAASMGSVSKSAVTTAESARAALTHVDLGDASVRETSAAMNRIQEAVQKTSQKMRTLARRVGEISNIIELIDEIASQSTLLSLNAAIQAAHAGEAGRGFEVVAEEIRKLADRSVGATKDVSRIIEMIQGETAEALEAMNHGARQVQGGCDLAERARQALHEISGAVRDSVKLSASISEASTEQAMVTRHLANTMETIAAITQATSTGAHQTARTVQALVGLARQLEQTIARFKVKGDLATTAGEAPRLAKRAAAEGVGPRRLSALRRPGPRGA